MSNTSSILLKILAVSLCVLAGCRIKPTPEAENMAVAMWNCVRLGQEKIVCSKNGEEPTAYQVPVSLVSVATPWQGMPCLLDDSGHVLCAQDERLSVFAQVSLQNKRYDRIIAGLEGVYAQSGDRDFTYWWFDPMQSKYTHISHHVPSIKSDKTSVYAYEYGQDAVFASEDASRHSYEIARVGSTADHSPIKSIDMGITDPILQRADWRLGAALSHVCRINGADSTMCEAAKSSVRFGATEAAGTIVKVDFGLRHGCWLSEKGIAFCFGERTADGYTACKLTSVDDLSIGRLSSCFSFVDGNFRCWPHNNGDGLRVLCESASPGDHF